MERTLKVHFFVLKEVISENPVLMYGQYLRAVFHQEQVMMERIRQIIFYDPEGLDFFFSRSDYKHAQLIVSITHSEVFSAQLGLAVSGTGQ